MEPLRTSVTSAEFVRHFGAWQDRAATRPIYVTHHGRERLVMLSVPNYDQLLERIAAADRHASRADAVRLGAVLERIPQGFLAVDRAMTVTEINPAACSYLRVSREQAVGAPITDPFPMLPRTLLFAYLMRAVQSGEVGSFDQSSVAFEGRWLRMETMPYLDGAACLFRDITEERDQRQRAEAETAVAEAMAAHGLVGRARLSTRGTFMEIDRPLAAMAGFEPEALARARFTDILPLSRRVQAAQEIEQVLSGGPPNCFRTALMVNRGGERPVRVAIAELRSEHGSDGAVMVVTPERMDEE
ncbi:MAG: PAS domain-containing protein [Sphingomonas fennica]